MKIAIIGGNEPIAAGVAARLIGKGHEIAVIRPGSGMILGPRAGLAATLAGARVVIDAGAVSCHGVRGVTDYAAAAVRSLFPAEVAAGVRHHIAVSTVGADCLQHSPYFRARAAQEGIIRGSGIPYTILRSAPSFEMAAEVADRAGGHHPIRLPTARIQPVSADDVSALLARIAIIAATNMTLEIHGPEPMGLDEYVRRLLESRWDRRAVIGDPCARYLGAAVTEDCLLPGRHAQIGLTTFAAWLDRAQAAA